MSLKKNNGWQRLDNAAKIFPSNSTKRDTKVFRFCCELTEPVDPVLLQPALEATLESFPLYRAVLKRGLFWYYFEQSDLPATVQPELAAPCQPLYIKGQKNLLFAVTYYRCRINLEIYHALTDGTGAMNMLQLLVSHYLALRHPEDFPHGRAAIPYDASMAQRMDDSFYKYYSGRRHPRQKEPNACQISGSRLAENRIRVTEGVLSVRQLLDLAHQYDCTLTIFLTAVFLQATSWEIPQKALKKPVVASVPVNLRQYFHSQSARNFFGVINVGYDFLHGSDQLAAIIASLKADFARELTREKLEQRMDSFGALERNPFIKLVPLSLKDPVLHLAGWASGQKNTVAISNVGKVKLPPALQPYVRLFSVFVSTEKVQVCLCSCGDALTASFTSPFASTEIEKNFFRILTGMGAAVQLDCSTPESWLLPPSPTGPEKEVP
ncbi:hypothetical protein [Neobittarella massiliensis]|uniref:hypothetical protein n=1 Tax=Neobittarella massiliensis (ex Bilen et al. 2018) TaxID=2041842 RepID=UPI001A92D288|nr:hypothetical protein [Neobittarella massiliensis]